MKDERKGKDKPCGKEGCPVLTCHTGSFEIRASAPDSCFTLRCVFSLPECVLDSHRTHHVKAAQASAPKSGVTLQGQKSCHQAKAVLPLYVLAFSLIKWR